MSDVVEFLHQFLAPDQIVNEPLDEDLSILYYFGFVLFYVVKVHGVRLFI